MPGDRERQSDFLTVDVGGIRVSSVYVPYNENGRIEWLKRLGDHIRKERFHLRDSVLCGDFNVKFRATVHEGRATRKLTRMR